jgi:MFS family permease
MLSHVQGLMKRIGDSAASFRAVVGNANLRRLELAWAWAVVGHWAYLVAVSIYAYGVGGTRAVGLMFFLRLVPAALLAPFAGLLADRYRRESVLLASAVTRIVLIGAAAVGVFLGVQPAVVYTLAIAAAIATAPFRPAQAALTPALARTPEELTAANAVASTIESLAIFVGPALAGLLLGVASTGLVFAVTAGMLVVTAFLLIRIRAPQAEAPKGEVVASTIVAELLVGFRAILRHGPLRIMIGLLTAQNALEGAVQVYIVVVAIDLLGLGTSGVGFLNSAIGIGALIGGILALSLTGAPRLSRPFLLGIVCMGLPVAIIGIWPKTVVALVMLGLLGAGACVMGVAGLTIVQRAVPDDVLARVFGVIQMLWLLSLSIGALVAPAIVSWIGIRGALIVTGTFLLALVALAWVPVAQIDATAVVPATEDLRILASVPMLAPLPGASLEHLAGRLVPLRIDSGTVIVREGDAGDRFYIVVEGKVEVSEDGRQISELEAGGYFGEIALIRDIPRTATVTARTPVVLYAMEREDFLAAVTGHPQSAQAAETVVSARMARVEPSGVRLPAG